MPDYDTLAELYDLEYDHDYDVDFWRAVARGEGSPLVEWGAGTGRLALPLAGEGFGVTAVEISRPMAERGRAKGGGVEWVVGDMRGLELERRYRLAICGFNSFLCLLTVDGALAFLRNAHRHLEPGGLLGIEVSAFSTAELAGGSQIQHDLTRQTRSGRLERFSATRYDPATRRMEMMLFYELYEEGSMIRKSAHDLCIRVTHRDELELMLRLAGFGVEAVYGGFEGETFDSYSDHLIVLARRG